MSITTQIDKFVKPHDKDRYFKERKEAVENGNKKEMNELATCYYYGVGTEKDLGKAFYWFKKAAKNSDMKAMNNLAACYRYGNGTEKDLKESFYWLKEAVKNGSVKSMNDLAMRSEEHTSELQSH